MRSIRQRVEAAYWWLYDLYWDLYDWNRERNDIPFLIALVAAAVLIVLIFWFLLTPILYDEYYRRYGVPYSR
jgi:hypothetical protein